MRELNESSVAAIQRAFQMASRLPTYEHAPLRVGVLSSEGVLVWSETLTGAEQAAFLSDQLRPLGFEEDFAEAAMRAFGCDILIRHAPVPEDHGGNLVKADDVTWPPAKGRPPSLNMP